MNWFKRSQSSMINYYPIGLDDSLLLSELLSIGSFSYMPNSGNMGDMLIAESTLRWFDKYDLRWSRLQEDQWPEVFVYGGGGAWISNWVDGLHHVMNIMQKAKKIVILPSSFDDVPDFIKILDERFVVFCREKKSFDYLLSQNTKAKILLDHDMAFRLLGNLQSNIKAPTKKLKKLSKNLLKKVNHLSGDVCLFRMDSESLGHYGTDCDLSDALGWFSSYEAREVISFAVNFMFEVLDKFQTVKTDRLHIAIAAALLGKDVVMYDNSYGKISGVYSQTLSSLTNVQLYNRKG